jgi:RNA polymerase sigma-70 factor (ECF subfamily)
VEFYTFDDSYMERLRCDDRATQSHFADYFGRLLRIKLRSRKLPVHVVCDMQQETFVRVLVAVRTGAVRQPDRLGPYVNSVCNNVLLEYFRETSRTQYEDLDAAEAADAAADLEARTIADERRESVHSIMQQLSDRDRAVLRGVLMERDKDEVCRELDVDRAYLRVLTHRAMGAFRELYRGKKGAGGFRADGKKMNDR